MSSTKRVRPLLIAEGANPALTSASLVGWSCARAIAEVTDAHIVTEWRNRDDFLRAGLKEGHDFTAIDIRRIQNLAWRSTKLLSRGEHFSWSLYAIFSNLVYPFFEREVWKQFAGRLKAGEFDLVHRILPLSPTTPSWISKHLQEIGVPWVLGPLNGGVPWPQGFDDVRKLENDGAGRLRSLYRLQPGLSSTRRLASAIITAARTTLREIPSELHERCVFIPENAIDAARFDLSPKPPRSPGPLRAAFVGRLVALKGVDMLLEAAAPLIRTGQVTLDIIGDGPERERLSRIIHDEGLQTGVRMEGWLDHTVLQPRLRESDLLAFPSIREFGGGAVLEAMALGLPPIVLDHGGPPELVPAKAGYVLPLQNRSQIISDLRALLEKLAQAPEQLKDRSQAAQAHVRQYYTWEAKAKQILEVYHWVLGQRTDKPTWGIPMGFE